MLFRKVSSNSNSFSNVLLKVSSKIKTDSCKLTYYPSAELKSTTPNPLPGSSTLKYNDSDTNVILVDGQNSENSYFQPQRDDTGSLQYIVSDVSAIVKHWIKNRKKGRDGDWEEGLKNLLRYCNYWKLKLNYMNFLFI